MSAVCAGRGGVVLSCGGAACCRGRVALPVRCVTGVVAISPRWGVGAWGLRVDVWRCGGMEVGAWGTADGGRWTADGFSQG